MAADFFKRFAENWTRFSQRTTHAQLLRSLPREQKRQLSATLVLRFAAIDAAGYYDPTAQAGVNDAYMTVNLTRKLGFPFRLNVGDRGNQRAIASRTVMKLSWK